MTEELKQYLQYNPETGVLTWIKKRGKIKIGDTVNTTLDNGYITVKFNSKCYKAHRVAWFLYYGTAPLKPLDHINGNRKDNRIVNLREVTIRQNANNMSVHRQGRLVGTSFTKGKYISKIEVDNKKLHLGCFSTELEAHLAYLNARQIYCGY